MKKILCIGTEWFSKNGGLSTFNRRLCNTLAKSNSVYCYLPEFSDLENKDAAENKVVLIKPKKISGMDPLFSMLSRPPQISSFELDIIIGHDRKTGPIMEGLRDNFYPKADTILFIHTAPGEIELYKPEQMEEDHAKKAEERENIQKDLAKNCSLIVAVGPKLYDEVVTYMSGVKNKPAIIRFDPGLYELPDNINYDFESTIPEALMLGRLEDFHLKGVDIAFKAMDIVYNEWEVRTNNIVVKPRFILRGSPTGTDRALREKLSLLLPETKLRPLIRNYTDNIDIINEEILRTALTLMPSRTEGFGLVALEAISLGRPILISENTGLARLIGEIAPEESHNWIIPNDLPNDGIERWAEAVKRILIDRKGAAEKLKILINKYSNKISWENSARMIIEKLNLNLHFDSSKASLSDFEFTSLPIWDNEQNKHVGPKADTNFIFDGETIVLERKNKEGRNIINIVGYYFANEKKRYISKKPTGTSERKIKISFDAKIEYSATSVYLVIHKKDDHGWLKFEIKHIANKDWLEYVFETTVSSELDFTIQIQEKEFKGNTGKVYLKNLIIREIR